MEEKYYRIYYIKRGTENIPKWIIVKASDLNEAKMKLRQAMPYPILIPAGKLLTEDRMKYLVNAKRLE